MPKVVINDSNYKRFINPVVNGERKYCTSLGMFPPDSRSGYRMRSFEEQVSVPLIPQSEWDDRIRQMEKDGATLEQLCNDTNLEVLDQNGTNYCWANGPTFAAMVCRMQESGREIRYSPASIAAPIKNFQNRGGWGEEALNYMIQNGINLQEDWPPNAINRSYYNQENKTRAMLHRPLEFIRCQRWEEMVSCLLANIPVAVGFNWWAHLVCAVGLSIGSHNLRIANSWSTSWGEKGFGWLEGQRKYFDGEAVAITAMSPI